MRREIMRRGVFLLLLFLAGACAPVSQQSVKTSPVQEEQVKEELLGENVPVYPGFKLIPEKSFIYESGNVKVGRLVFKGRAPIKEIVSYYKETLPEKGWEPLTITIYGNSAELTFTTPEKVLQIQVLKGFSETEIVLSLGPKGELTNRE
jgi:hypothetical protein